jgi:hypothetical protein
MKSMRLNVFRAIALSPIALSLSMVAVTGIYSNDKAAAEGQYPYQIAQLSYRECFQQAFDKFRYYRGGDAAQASAYAERQCGRLQSTINNNYVDNTTTNVQNTSTSTTNVDGRTFNPRETPKTEAELQAELEAMRMTMPLMQKFVDTIIKKM